MTVAGVDTSITSMAWRISATLFFRMAMTLRRRDALPGAANVGSK
jgi:hypothetical protein